MTLSGWPIDEESPYSDTLKTSVQDALDQLTDLIKNIPTGGGDMLNADNLQFLTDFATARANLSVASIAQMDLAIANAGFSQALARTPVKTTAYTAVPGDFVPVDTTGGPVTITLPQVRPDRTVVGIKHIIQSGTNAVTYSCGAGTARLEKAGGASTGLLSNLMESVLLEYDQMADVWTSTSTYIKADPVGTAAFYFSGIPTLVSDNPARLGVNQVGTVLTLVTAGMDDAFPLRNHNTVDVSVPSTTFVPIPGLSVPLLANTLYKIEVYLFYTSPSAAGLALKWSPPDAASWGGQWSANGLAPGAAAVDGQIRRANRGWGTSDTIGSAGAGALAIPCGTFNNIATAGPLQLTVAQATANGTPAVILRNSMILATALT